MNRKQQQMGEMAEINAAKAQHDTVREELRDLQQTTQLTPVMDALRPLASANGNVEATKLLEQTPSKQDKAEGQGELTAHLTEVLFNVPGELPRSPQKQFREALVPEDAVNSEANSHHTAEIRAAVEKAVTACNKAIAAGDLSHCMRPLSDLAQQYRASTALADAMRTCEARRAYKAAQLLREAMQTAQKQLRSSSAKKAEATLKRVEFALPFASTDAHDEWQRLKGECAAALSAKPMPKSGAPAKRSQTRWYVVGLALILAAVAIVGLLHRRSEASNPENSVTAQGPLPTSVTTDMEINASPWARVVSIQDEAGNRIAMPDGDPTTPIQLDAVKSGTYKITLVGADGKQQLLECNVSSEQHLCAVDMGSPDTEQVLIGEQP